MNCLIAMKARETEPNFYHKLFVVPFLQVGGQIIKRRERRERRKEEYGDKEKH